MAENKVYGIDLGTTYSAIAFVNEDGKTEIIPNSDSDRVTPSVVFFESTDKIIVGKEARETAKTDPDRVVSFVIREIGTAWTKEIDGKAFTPEEISAFILKRLANDAKLTADHDVKDVVITCPAYFNDAERQATRAAGQIAGLNVIQILDEPVAAAINYGFNNIGENCTAIVYDLGGGTFDVTVIKIENGSINVVCTDGDHRLGGGNWDERLIQYFINEFQTKTGAGDDIADDTETMYDLQLLAEGSKKLLTRKESTVVRVTHGGEKVNIELSREKFNELTQDLLARTIQFTDKVLEIAASKGITKINDFLLVGGSTRMPQVMDAVKSNFADKLGVEPKSFDQDEAVAKGAAIYGQIKNVQANIDSKIDNIKKEAESQGKEISNEEAKNEAIQQVAEEEKLELEVIKDIINRNISTVASKSYGIRVKKGKEQYVVFNMIKKQTTVPTDSEREFPITEANAKKLLLTVFENNEMEQVAQIDDSSEVGNATMELTPGLPAGAPIRVKFTLTEEGVLTMSALDVTNNKSIDAKFDAKDGLSAEEIEQKRKENADISID